MPPLTPPRQVRAARSGAAARFAETTLTAVTDQIRRAQAGATARRIAQGASL